MPWPIIGKLIDRWFPSTPPPEAMRQLKALGYTSEESLAHWTKMWRYQGRRFFWDILTNVQNRQKQEKDRIEWVPRLREYAAQCRIDCPLPLPESLSVTDLKKYSILCQKIEDTLRRERIDSGQLQRVLIIQGNPVSLLAAQATLGTSSDLIVYLLQTECFHWFNEIYKPDGDPLWWYFIRSWKFEDLNELNQDQANLIASNFPKPEGFDYWVLSIGSWNGELAGEETSELWKWDGENAEPIKIFDWWVS